MTFACSGATSDAEDREEAAFHHPRPARRRLQDEKFGDGERHRLVFPGSEMPLGGHAQLAAFQNVFGRGSRRRPSRHLRMASDEPCSWWT
jgi:hypothetical protein